MLHEAAYRELGLDALFEVLDVVPGDLEHALARARAQGFRQLAVSLPHKERALALADRASTAARAIGAANTLTFDGQDLLAENTDWIGVREALAPHGPLEGARVLVLGAGGAARAVTYALRSAGAEVGIANRTRARAVRLAADLGARVVELDAAYDLLVNATPIGMHPAPDASPLPRELLREGALVFDTVYRPLETRLLREARAAGCRTQDGLAMLVHQAIEQIRLWSGKSPSAARLRRAAEEVLARA